MSWRILPILFLLPFHFAFAAEPTWENFVSGATWSFALSSGEPRLAEQAVQHSPYMTNIKLGNYEEGRFFKIAAGAQYLFFLGVADVVPPPNKSRVNLYFGSPMSRSAFEQLNKMSTNVVVEGTSGVIEYIEPRFLKVYKVLEQANTYLEKAEGVPAIYSIGELSSVLRSGGLAEVGAFGVGRVQLNSELTVDQRTKFMKKIYELSKSCDSDLADWTGR